MQTISPSKPTALITGVSRSQGLGFAVARQLAEKGYHVILTARNVGQAEALAVELRALGLHACALELDLSDSMSIAALAQRLSRELEHLDVLVNNASAMPDFQTRSVLNVNPETLRTLFEVNVFGCWTLIQALLPSLLQAPAARIVNVTSSAAQQIGKSVFGDLFSPAYSLSKYTLNALTITLAGALANTRLLVNAVDPGSVASHPERGDDKDDLSPDEAARIIIRAATLDRDGPTGKLFQASERA